MLRREATMPSMAKHDDKYAYGVMAIAALVLGFGMIFLDWGKWLTQWTKTTQQEGERQKAAAKP
jgi:hypothetical protein